MQTVEIPYKKDDAGFDLISHVSFAVQEPSKPKPIVLAYHAGGLVIGSGAIIPQAQLKYLTETLGFIVVAPNYRLAPQISASKGAVRDAFDAYEWARTSLSTHSVIKEHGIQVDATKIATMGHSSGGGLALILSSAPNPPKAILSFYSSFYISRRDTPVYKPYGGFPQLPPYVDSEENRKELYDPLPNGQQLSSFPLPKPGSLPGVRSRWHVTNMTKGQWIDAIEFGPDANPAAFDPVTYISASFPPVMLVQGEADDIPASTLDLAEKFTQELKDKGAQEVELVAVPGAKHMFDLMLEPGQEGWDAVERGLNFLAAHVQ